MRAIVKSTVFLVLMIWVIMVLIVINNLVFAMGVSPLKKFETLTDNGEITLNWQTDSKNLHGFVVQIMKLDDKIKVGSGYKTLSFIEYVDENQNYQYKIENNLNGIYYVRLLLVNIDNSIVYGIPQEVQIKNTTIKNDFEKINLTSIDK